MTTQQIILFVLFAWYFGTENIKAARREGEDWNIGFVIGYAIKWGGMAALLFYS
jgi:hypothetical protein